MATTISTIYPPQVETFMPSFLYNNSAEVWFKLSSYSEDMLNKIRFIHVSMVDQRNNMNVFAGKNGNTDVYPQYYPISCYEEKNGVIRNMKDILWDSSKKMYKITIPPQVIKQIIKTGPYYYNPNQYYKIQLRFDLTGDQSFPAESNYDNPTQFFYLNSSNKPIANALKLAAYTNYNQDNFSEWSTGTLIKPILIPTLKINIEDNPSVFPSTDTLVNGSLTFNKHKDDENKYSENNPEWLSWYRIKIPSEISASSKPYFDTNVIYANKNAINCIVDTSGLSAGESYYWEIEYETNNGYYSSISIAVETKSYADKNTNINYTKNIDNENGIIKLNITSLSIEGLNTISGGNLVVRRASHRTNFKQWDLIGTYKFSSLPLTIEDNTIESMTGYRYQLQYINDENFYKPVYIEDDDILHCDFYGGIFSDKNKMLKTEFNFQISNRSNAVNRTKTDTLGGQYPIFTQNAKLKYHTYSISGRISTEDNGELFLPKDEIFGEEYYNYRYNPAAISPHTTECQSIKSNNDWLYEREYRDAVEEWLNNGKPKLFRSMTEGNMIVMLDGITMTPDAVLGRRLYDFSATIYEIGDGKDLNSIASFGLFDIKDER